MEIVRGKVGDRPWGLTIATLWRRRLTGQLNLLVGTERFAIAFDDGDIVGAQSALAGDSAARIAVEVGVLAESHASGVDDIDEVARVAKLPIDRAIAFRRFVIARRAARTFAFEHGEFVVEDQISIDARSECVIDTRAVLYRGALVMNGDRVATQLRELGERFRLVDKVGVAQYGFGDVPLDHLRRGVAVAELATHRERAVVFALVCARDCEPMDRDKPDGVPVVAATQATAVGTGRVPTPERMPAMGTGRIATPPPQPPPDPRGLDALAAGTARLPKRTTTPVPGVPFVPLKRHATDRVPVNATSKITPPFGISTRVPVDGSRAEEAAAAFRRGELALSSGQHDAAIEDLTRATELRPDHGDYIATLAWARFCASSNKEAVADETRRALTAATTKTPNQCVPLFYLACVARDLSRTREALRLYQRVLHLEPEHRDARRELVALTNQMNKRGILDRFRG